MHQGSTKNNLCSYLFESLFLFVHLLIASTLEPSSKFLEAIISVHQAIAPSQTAVFYAFHCHGLCVLALLSNLKEVF